MSTDEEKRQAAFLASAMDAWFTTSLELDRSLLSLSAGGIGLLLTVVSFKGIHTHWQLVVFVLALTFFVLCIVSVLAILHANKAFLTRVINSKDSPSAHLDFMDVTARVTFVVAVLLSVVLGIGAASDSVYKSEGSMANKDHGSVQGLNESFAGAASISGSETLKKSFSGAQALPAQPHQQQPAQPANESQSTTQQQSGSGNQTTGKPAG